MRIPRCRFIPAVLLNLLLLAALAVAQAPSRVVSRPVVNMYSGASADTDVVSQAIYGSTVKLLQEKDGWALVQTPDAYKGWVRSDVLLSAAYGEKGVLQVTSLFAHIYREPDVTAHAPLLTVPFETKLEVAPRAMPEGWVQVRLADGGSGWVQTGDTSALGPPLSIGETIVLAKRFLGLPYTWGGTSSFGYDCSGFVQMLMRQRGVIIPRDADIQAAWSGFVSVDRDKLQPGDLLYFGDAPDKITHTAMYIGDNQFINATTYQHPVIRIDSLAEPRWARLLVAARRVKP